MDTNLVLTTGQTILIRSYRGEPRNSAAEIVTVREIGINKRQLITVQESKDSILQYRSFYLDELDYQTI